MKNAVSLIAFGIFLTTAGIARAQPPEPMPMQPAAEKPSKGQIAAPKNALELQLGTGYTQGFGSLQSGVGMPSVVTPGIGFDLGVGYRIDPRWAVLWQGEYAEFNAQRTEMARAFTTGIAAQYHFMPMQELDPWFEFGVGYRFLVEDPAIGPNLLTHGFQLGRLRAGLDIRASEAVALGPVIGADATMFLFQDIPRVQTNIADPRVSTFIFAGLQGRFDFIETKSSGSKVASAAAKD